MLRYRGAVTEAYPTAIDLSKSFTDTEDGATGLTYTILSNSNTGLVTTQLAGNYLNLIYSKYYNGGIGTADITVRAADKGGLYADAKFTVTVNMNRILQDQVFAKDSYVSFSFPYYSFISPTGKPLTYTVAGKPSWLSFSESYRLFSGTARTGVGKPPLLASYNISVTATDNAGYTETKSFTLYLAGVTFGKTVIDQYLSPFSFPISLRITYAGNWTIKGVPPWFTLDKTSGTGDATVSISHTDADYHETRGMNFIIESKAPIGTDIGGLGAATGFRIRDFTIAPYRTVGAVDEGKSTIMLQLDGINTSSPQTLNYEIVGAGYKVTYKGAVYIVTKYYNNVGSLCFQVGKLISARDDQTEDSPSMFVLGFDKPVYSVSAQCTDNGGGGSFSAYDSDNNLLQTVKVTGSEPVTYTLTNADSKIAKIIFSSTDGWIGGLSYKVNAEPGDINFDRVTDLADTILMLQVLTGIELPPDMVYPQMTISGTRVGLEDVIINLQKVAGLR